MEIKIDLFTQIHKAVRAMPYETGSLLQTAYLGKEPEMQDAASCTASKALLMACALVPMPPSDIRGVLPKV